MEETPTLLSQIFGSPQAFGADSWMEVFYWFGGAIVAVVALFALRNRVSQARAHFLLQLDERWASLAKPRRKMREQHELIVLEVYKDHASLEDKHRLVELRKECKSRVDQMAKEETELYDEFIQYIGFFETVGVMVRNDYIPLRTVIQMYKGPIFDIDIMFRLHIEEWQKRAHIASGLFENLLYLIKRTRRRERITSVILFWK